MAFKGSFLPKLLHWEQKYKVTALGHYRESSREWPWWKMFLPHRLVPGSSLLISATSLDGDIRWDETFQLHKWYETFFRCPWDRNTSQPSCAGRTMRAFAWCRLLTVLEPNLESLSSCILEIKLKVLLAMRVQKCWDGLWRSVFYWRPTQHSPHVFLNMPETPSRKGVFVFSF